MNQPPGLRPPRFGLKALMWIVTVLAVCFASIGYFGSHVTAVLFLFALVILAHVFGNAMGTQLRDLGSNRSREPVVGRAKSAQLTEADFAPVTRLRHRAPLGRPLTIVTLVGAAVSGLGGGFAFLQLMEPPIRLGNVSLGFVAAAVLGGIWTFVAGSFLQVAAGAWWQAMRDSKRK